MLSVAMLLLGVVAGAQLSAARQSQERILRAAHTAQPAQEDLRAAAERDRISAVSRAAQREAQAKADAAASVAADQAKAAQSPSAKAQARPSASASAKASPSPFGPIPASCSEYSGNVAIGCALMLDAGYGLDQMPCLNNLWQKESGWRTSAGNASTGAYGIPQALPGSKMAAYGADWRTNPATQIKWGLNYIKTKYKTPCGAWSTFRAKGYY
ncbi:lytic transglycosylase domain-containing protein [Planosporangium flavigriseum]|nr:lytic transglycosylase domain-containing protein [Planosporangium flavigriseum]